MAQAWRGANIGLIVIQREYGIFTGSLLLLVLAVGSNAQGTSGTAKSGAPSSISASEKDRLFRSGAEAYETGRYADAVAPLEKLVREAPEVFEVHELLGLVYAAQSQDTRANEHLAKAVRLKPDSASARSNLAASYARLGKMDLAEEQFSKAVDLEPDTYDTNHNLGAAFAHNGKVAKAIPYLERAQNLNPASYDNGYDLSLAYFVTGRLKEARSSVQSLIKVKDTAELHNLLAQIEEKDGNFIAAVSEFQTAAHLDPSESNLFDWGGELLLHRTLDPAVEVFKQATERYPQSPRLVVGLGMAYYARGNYDDAVKAFLRGADLDPHDARCYKFLSRAYDSSPSQAADVIERFRRYATMQPNNGLALYYYAMSIWKGKRAQDPEFDPKPIDSLLRRAIASDPNLAEAHLQLGNLTADQGKFAEAIPEYQRALDLNSDLADAHYRLGQAYVRTAQKEKAQQQFEVYQQLRAQHLADLDKQRADIRQFVYSDRVPDGATKKETARP
jgi:tetratricopeptide (TPR) repeat protein